MKKIWLILLLFMPLTVSAKDTIYLNLEKSEYIKITDNQVTLNNQTIQIEDFTNYQSIFLTEEDETYPLYIIYSGGKYSFSDYKKSNNEATYILASRMYSFNTKATTSLANTCQSLFGVQLINLLKNNVLKIIYLLIPIIIIVCSTFDFAKLVFSDDKDGIKGSFKKFLNRSIAAILIFLVPNILIFLTTILGSNEIKSCIQEFNSQAGENNEY